jgi:hypothetical protein
MPSEPSLAPPQKTGFFGRLGSLSLRPGRNAQRRNDPGLQPANSISLQPGAGFGEAASINLGPGFGGAPSISLSPGGFGPAASIQLGPGFGRRGGNLGGAASISLRPGPSADSPFRQSESLAMAGTLAEMQFAARQQAELARQRDSLEAQYQVAPAA